MIHHVAIMNKKLGLISKVLSGEKKIESRWYQTRRAPWDKINIGDIIWFKESGGLIKAKAKVEKVKQFRFENDQQVQKIINKYGKRICLDTWMDLKKWKRVPRYCILMWLCKVKDVKPFNIDKRGFGKSTAWMYNIDLENVGIWNYDE